MYYIRRLWFRNARSLQGGVWRQMFTEDGVSVVRVIFCEFKLFDQVGASTSQSRNIQDYKDVPYMRDKCRFAAQGDGVIRQVGPIAVWLPVHLVLVSLVLVSSVSGWLDGWINSSISR